MHLEFWSLHFLQNSSGAAASEPQAIRQTSRPFPCPDDARIIGGRNPAPRGKQILLLKVFQHVVTTNVCRCSICIWLTWNRIFMDFCPLGFSSCCDLHFEGQDGSGLFAVAWSVQQSWSIFWLRLWELVRDMWKTLRPWRMKSPTLSYGFTMHQTKPRASLCKKSPAHVSGERQWEKDLLILQYKVIQSDLFIPWLEVT